MAQLIPESKRGGTRGELLVAGALKSLPENYLVYNEPYINNRRPDFVIFGPDLGAVVLEVKDYLLSSIVEANKNEWLIKSGVNIYKNQNPLAQAREYAQHMHNMLGQISELVNEDGPFQGKLRFPYGYGVVFTRMNQEELLKSGLYSIIPPELCLAREEIDPDHHLFDGERLKEKIQGMFAMRFHFPRPLSSEDMELIRYQLFPEVRISASRTDVNPEYKEQLLFSLRDIKVMDLNQENLAKSLGDQHRLLRGVAGSGKTLVLACRAKHLRQINPEWKVLVLCYNITLISAIRQMIEDIGDTALPSDNIEVENFHNWCFRHWGIKDEAMLGELVESIDRGEQSFPQYDAILVDEGQDFDSDWLRLVYKTLNPETNSFLLVEDRAQQIYTRKSLAQSIGLSFQGRSRILTVNYRNAEPVIRFAWNFYQHFAASAAARDRDGSIGIVPPQSAKKHGFTPVVKRFVSFKNEANAIARAIKKLHEVENIDYSDIAILYRVKRMKEDYVEILKQSLNRLQLPFYWVSENASSKRRFKIRDQGVKISTIDSAKGLEFKAVLICNVDNMPFSKIDDPVREAALLYVGMTRATERLFITYSGESDFTNYFDGFVK